MAAVSSTQITEEKRREAARKIARFRDSVNKRVNAEALAIQQEVEAFRETELSKYRAYEESAEHDWLARRQRDCAEDCRKAVEERRVELRRAYSERRDELRRSVFADAETRLREFAQSPEYKTWLDEKCAPYKGGDWELTYVEGGGFVAKGAGRVADFSFAKALAEQEEWFLAESGL